MGPEEQDPSVAYAEFPGGLYGVTECVLGDAPEGGLILRIHFPVQKAG